MLMVLATGRRQFWEQVESKGLLAQDDLIMAGDLKFYTSIDEVWGVGALSDPLASFFRDLFKKIIWWMYNHRISAYMA
jgi:hypothetical protein